jgi:hypothetical protein
MTYSGDVTYMGDDEVIAYNDDSTALAVIPDQPEWDMGAIDVVRPPQQAVTLAADPYVGVSAVPFDEKAQLVLAENESVPDEWIDIRPEGLLYLSHMKARHILNKAFGFGGWAVVPVGEFRVEEQGNHIILYRQFRLYVNGRFVGETVASGDYWTNNKSQNYADAAEACQSYAINRLGKNFGIAAQCWDKAYGERWKSKYAHKDGDGKWKKKLVVSADAGAIDPSPEQFDTRTPQPSPSNSSTAPASAVSTTNQQAPVAIISAGKQWKYQGLANGMFTDADGKKWKGVGDVCATLNDAVAHYENKGIPVMLRLEYKTERDGKYTNRVIVGAEVLN